MIAQLQHDHDRLRAIADQIDAFLDSASPPSDPNFAQLRWMMVREVSMHLAVERNALTGWHANAGKRGEQLDVGFDDAFTRHVVAWSGATLSIAWEQYRSATSALLRRLRKRMEFEESAMFPAIARKRFA